MAPDNQDVGHKSFPQLVWEPHTQASALESRISALMCPFMEGTWCPVDYGPMTQGENLGAEMVQMLLMLPSKANWL